MPKSSPFGAAHTNSRDAYRDIPILKQPTWNNEVAAYFFFGGITAGSAMLGSIAEIMGGEKHARIARMAHFVSFASLLPCPPLLIDDLGMPRRFHHMLRVFKPASPMNLGSWALLAHGAGSTLHLARVLANDGELLSSLPLAEKALRHIPNTLLSLFAIPSAGLLGGYTGVLLGVTSVPVWNSSPLLGGLFMASSFSTGTAATSLASSMKEQGSEDEKGTLTTMGAIGGLAESALLMGYVATSGEGKKHLLSGLGGKLLAGAVACLGVSTALEVISVVTGKHSKGATTVANIAALASGALLRWAVVKAGKASSADREGTLKAMSKRQGSPGWNKPQAE